MEDLEMEPNQLKEALRRFGEIMEVETGKPLTLVIGGGAGLVLTEQIMVGTFDVDVLAVVEGGKLKKPSWDEAFETARKVIAEEMGLRSDWINAGPAGLVEKVPKNFKERLLNQATRIQFGDRVTILAISRLDQIYFKTYAALNKEPGMPKQGKHVMDLYELSATVEEILAGVRWACENFDDFPPKNEVLQRRLIQLGRELDFYPPDQIYENINSKRKPE